jgi:hypothetical protein
MLNSERIARLVIAMGNACQAYMDADQKKLTQELVTLSALAAAAAAGINAAK